MAAEPFSLRPAYAARAKSRKGFGLIEGDVMDVRVQFSREVSDYFTERQWHPTQKIKKLKNGDVIVSFQAGGMDEIVSWVLSWGSYARVLSPVILSREVAQHLKSLHEYYNELMQDGVICHE